MQVVIFCRKPVPQEVLRSDCTEDHHGIRSSVEVKDYSGPGSAESSRWATGTAFLALAWAAIAVALGANSVDLHKMLAKIADGILRAENRKRT